MRNYTGTSEQVYYPPGKPAAPRLIFKTGTAYPLGDGEGWPAREQARGVDGSCVAPGR